METELGPSVEVDISVEVMMVVNVLAGQQEVIPVTELVAPPSIILELKIPRRVDRPTVVVTVFNVCGACMSAKIVDWAG